MKKLLLILVLTAFALPLMSQYTYFNDVYENNSRTQGNCILETESSYVVFGQIYDEDYTYSLALMAIDKMGNQLWLKTHGETSKNYNPGFQESLIQTEDGGYLACGYIQDLNVVKGIIMKFDQDGDSLWSVIYGDSTQSHERIIFYSCKQLPDKGYLLAGDKVYGDYNPDMFVIRLDNSGILMWERNYGDPELAESTYSLELLPDGGFLVGFSRQEIGVYNSVETGLLKADSLGNMIWMKTYGGIYNDGGGRVCLAPDGNYLVGSNFGMSSMPIGMPESKIWIFKTDTSGNVLWDKKYGNAENKNFLYSMKVMNDGSILASGTGGFLSMLQYGWILNTRSNGDSLWLREYNPLPDVEASIMDATPTRDHGIAFTGVGMNAFWVGKLDSAGCVEPGCDPTFGLQEAKLWK